MPQSDSFGIQPGLRFLLLIRVFFPVVLIGIVIWGVSQPGLELTAIGPIVLVGLLAYGLYQLAKLVRWTSYTITLSEDGITIHGTFIRWEHIAAATARSATQFDTFIELRTATGITYGIPAAIEQSSFILTVCEKHLPFLLKKA
jgi:hypothetical protein